jgi:undecaprenyl-diphosphatase
LSARFRDGTVSGSDISERNHVDWDVALFHAINGLAGRWPWLDQFMRFFAAPDNFIVLSVVALGCWVWAKGWRAVIGAICLAAMVETADFTATRIKYLVARPRPCAVLEQVHRVAGCGRAYSFPSNHAVNTVAAATFFQVLHPRTGWIAWPIVTLIGFGRVYLGFHYVTDVLAGWLLGGALGWVAGWFLMRRLSRGSSA